MKTPITGFYWNSAFTDVSGGFAPATAASSGAIPLEMVYPVVSYIK
jgi:hypothetical protein